MIIAFAGPAGSGKTFAQTYVVSRRNTDFYGHDRAYRARPFSFATLLKQVAAHLWKPTVDHAETYRAFYGDQQAKAAARPWLDHCSGREFLQELGDLCRQYNPDVFLNALKDLEGVLTVVDDCRYRNEAERVMAMGGVVVYIQRTDAENGAGAHASEQDVQAWRKDINHFVIENNGTQAEFEAELRQLLVDLELEDE